MIRLKDVKLNEEGLLDMAKDLEKAGYRGEEAQRISDEALVIAASFFQTLDDKIANVAKEEDDQLVIQAIVLRSVAHTSDQIMRMIEAKLMMQVIRKMFR